MPVRAEGKNVVNHDGKVLSRERSAAAAKRKAARINIELKRKGKL